VRKLVDLVSWQGAWEDGDVLERWFGLLHFVFDTDEVPKVFNCWVDIFVEPANFTEAFLFYSSFGLYEIVVFGWYLFHEVRDKNVNVFLQEK
jgi:hypothetical protein